MAQKTKVGMNVEKNALAAKHFTTIEEGESKYLAPRRQRRGQIRWDRGISRELAPQDVDFDQLRTWSIISDLTTGMGVLKVALPLFRTKKKKITCSQTELLFHEIRQPREHLVLPLAYFLFDIEEGGSNQKASSKCNSDLEKSETAVLKAKMRKKPHEDHVKFIKTIQNAYICYSGST